MSVKIMKSVVELLISFYYLNIYSTTTTAASSPTPTSTKLEFKIHDQGKLFIILTKFYYIICNGQSLLPISVPYRLDLINSLTNGLMGSVGLRLAK
ncbi:hypothetical protein FF38_04549 [Lucilia cuprina]|uniref:Uncharacterized protein n=1 Tax=Lucilia cuprina TaxID=7375 RepID=A0A0L0CPE0_LUCCU|nr:hypothetical protein FF38_04549 [Lucilia cuprina]